MPDRRVTEEKKDDTGVPSSDRKDTAGSNQKEDDGQEDTGNFEQDFSGTGNKNKIMIAVTAAAVVILSATAVIFTLNSTGGDSSIDNTVSNTLPDDTSAGEIYDSEGNLIYDEDNNVVNPDAINPGEKGFTGNDGGTPPEEVYNSSDFLKDINGVDVSAVYNVESVEFVYDYVNYNLRRGIMGDGIEIYWLDISYKKMKYRAQIPFYYAKDLDDSGIIRMHIEVLNLEGGGKIISYMEIAQPEN